MNEEEHDLCARVAAAYCLEPEVLLGACRLPEVVEARWLLMALLYRRGHSAWAIARLLGKDHDTVVYGLVRAGVRRPPPSQRARHQTVGGHGARIRDLGTRIAELEAG